MKNNKGFTLVEVLAVVVLMAIVVTFAFRTYNYVIKTSKNKTLAISTDNIKSTAELYSKENKNISKWYGMYLGNTNYKFYCVTIQELIDEGYFGNNKNITSNNGINNKTLIRIVKDMNNMTIVKTEITKDKTVEECTTKLEQELEESQGLSDDDFYTIKYDTNGGEPIGDDKVKKGESVELPLAKRGNYQLSGWFSSRTGGAKIGGAKDIITPTFDMEIYAHWLNCKCNVEFVSGNLLDGYSLATHNVTLTKKSKTNYVIESSVQYGGASFSEEIFKNGKTYIISFDFQKISGDFVNIGGHSAAAEQISFTVDGEESPRPYNQPEDNMVDMNDNDKHTIEFKFKYLPNNTTSTDKKIYIQPNRNDNSEIAIEITNLTIYEVVENRTMTCGSNYNPLPKISRTGYKFKGWYMEPTGNNEITETTFSNAIEDHKVYARWTPNKIGIRYHVNGGTFAAQYGATYTLKNSIVYRDNNDIFYKYNYGDTLGEGGLLNYNNSQHLNVVKSGYTVNKNAVWCKEGMTECYDQTSDYEASNFCDASKGDCEVTLYLNWVVGKVQIKYHVNKGALASKHGAAYSIKDNLIYNSSTESDVIQTISYGKSLGSSGLADWNNQNSINISRVGYTINSNSVWCTTDSGGGKCFDQTTAYAASNFCDASKGDCEVILYAHWVPQQYKVSFRGIGGYIRINDNSFEKNNNLLASYSNLWNRGIGHIVNYNDSVDLIDLSGNRYWGIINGTKKWGSDYLEFNGTNNYVDLGQMNSAKMTIIATFSVPSVTSTNNRNIVGSWHGGGGGLSVTKAGYIEGSFCVTNSSTCGSYATSTSTTKVVANQIYTAAVTYDGSAVRLYVDGVAAPSAPASGSILTPSGSTHMIMGCNPSGSGCENQYFSGKIYELAILKAALTDTRVRQSSGLTVTYGAKYTGLPTPTRNGYDFDGWYLSSSGGTKITSESSVTTASNHILYARWKPYIVNDNYQIISVGDNKFALDVENAGTANGTNIQIYPKGSGVHAQAQTWKVVNIGDGGIRIINIYANKVIDLSGGVAENGRNIQIYSWNGTAAQRWYPFKINNSTFILKSGTNRNFAIDIESANYSNNTNIQLWTNNNTTAQRYNFVKVDYDGKYTIVYNPNGGKGTMENQPDIAWDKTIALRKNTFTKTGYTFKGWSKKSTAKEAEYTDGQSVRFLTDKSEDVTLYAVWKDETKPTCSVSKVESTRNSTTGVTTKVTCSDNGSGCKSNNPTGDTGLKKSKTYTVYDNAGNSNTCSVTITTKIQYRSRTKKCSRYGTKCVGGYVSKSYTLTCNLSEYDANSYSDFYSKYKCGNCYCGYKSVWNSCKSTTTDYSNCKSYSYGSWSGYSSTVCNKTSTRDCGTRTLYS